MTPLMTAVTFNIISIITLLYLIVLIFTNTYLDKKRKRLFFLAAATNFLIIMFECGDYLIAFSNLSYAYIFRRIFCFLGFSLSPVVAMLLYMLVINKKGSNAPVVPAIVNAAICFISIFYNLVFTVSPDLAYTRGPLFVLPVICSAYYLLLLFFKTAKNFKVIDKIELVFLITLFFAFVFIYIFQVRFNIPFIIWAYCAMALLLYYLFLHIQFFKMDPMTGCGNRTLFEHDLKNLSKRCPAYIAVFDVNDLKKVNDEQGHAAGDKLIKRCAILIRTTFYGLGNLYRIGGDEFVFLAKNTTEQAFLTAVDKFKSRLNAETIDIACGYSFYDGSSDTHAAFKLADDNMYLNKKEIKMIKHF